MKPRILLLTFTAGLLMMWQWTVAAPQAGHRLQSFTAEYRLSRSGIEFGKVEMTLQRLEEDGYRYQAKTIPIGLFALFKKDEITEVSEGHIRGETVIPENYLYNHQRSKKPRRVELSFDWKAGRVTNRTPNSRWTMPIQNGTQDKFSKQLALMMAMANNSKQVIFSVADGGRLKRYQFNIIGRESIRTAAGDFDTIKVARSKERNPSQTTLWLAPELGFLPVQVKKKNEDGLFLMKLQDIAR